jgi:hypothetical protein
MSEDTLLVLASALATKVDWHQPLKLPPQSQPFLSTMQE